MDSTGHMWTVLDRLRDTQIEHGHLLRAIADRQEQTLRGMVVQQRQILTALQKPTSNSTPRKMLQELWIRNAGRGLSWATLTLAGYLAAHLGNIDGAFGMLFK